MVFDVIIIGGGPAGLAAAARLHEHTPSATFTDDEHQRYHWIRKHGRKMNIKNYRNNKNSLPTPPSSPDNSDCGCDSHPTQKGPELDMLVLDADGAGWMAKWHRLFKTFGIDYLRSPMFFQIDPADRDALLAYAYEQEREKELRALPGCAGKEVSKHKQKKRLNARGRFMGSGPDVDERDRKDYYVPSTKLFASHCAEVMQRYSLGKDLIRQEKAVDIVYDTVESFLQAGHDDLEIDDELQPDSKVFRVTTESGVRFSKIVILAIGPGNAPTIPPFAGMPSSYPHEGCTHAMHIKELPPPHMKSRINNRQSTSMLIVGGGLTSVQIADLALKRGVSQVHLFMRGPLKVKYFDIELDWVGKFRNFKQAEFWTADTDEERFEMYMEARNGGSITPYYRKILDAHMASGKICLHTHTSLTSANWNEQTKKWESLKSSPETSISSIDYIVFATGIQSDIRTLPFLQNMHTQYPIETIGGLPCLNDDLMWDDDVPLFINGRFAGLRLGPGAPNLVGARIGAERIAWNVEDVLKKLGRSKNSHNVFDEDTDSSDERMESYAAARDNRFDSLAGMDE